MYTFHWHKLPLLSMGQAAVMGTLLGAQRLTAHMRQWKSSRQGLEMAELYFSKVKIFGGLQIALEIRPYTPRSRSCPSPL